MKHLKIFVMVAVAMSFSTQCMELPLHLFVQTSDDQITLIKKKNISRMCALDVMNAHQHKDFSFIAEEKKKKNSLINPLDVSVITKLTGADLQLLDNALDVSKNKEIFYNFYSNLKRNEQITLFDAAIQVQSGKIISLLGLPLAQETQKIIISSILPQLPSIVALKQAILRKTSPTVSVLEGHAEGFKGKVLWNPDNSILVFTNSKPDEFIIRNGQTGKLIITIPNKYAKKMFFSPDGTRLLYTISDGLYLTEAYLCDGHTGKNINVFDVDYESKIVFSPDSKTIVVSRNYRSCDKKLPIMIYNAQTGDLIRTAEHDAPGINDLVFTADSKNFISVGKGSDNNKIILWDTNGKKINFLKGHHNVVVTHVAFSPDYSRLATGSMQNYSSGINLILRDSTTGDKIKSLKGQDNDIKFLLFSPDNKYLLSGACCSSPKMITIWNAQTGNRIKGIKRVVDFSTELIAFAQDNSFLIIDDTLYDTQIFEPITKLSVPEKELFVLAVSPDGNCIAARTQGTSSTLVLCKLFTDKMLNSFNAIESGITDLFQAYKFSELCKKFGVVTSNKKYSNFVSTDPSCNFSC